MRGSPGHAHSRKQAPPLCGHCARRKPGDRGASPVRDSRSRSRHSEAATYARYPRFPQAESVLCDSVFMTASRRGQRRSTGNGSRTFPATARAKPGLLSHQAEATNATAGRLTKPPPGGGSGLARRGSERGRLREAPIRTRGPSGQADGTRPDTGSSDRGPARRKAGLGPAHRHRTGRSLVSGQVGQDRISIRGLRNRQTQSFGSRTARRNQGFGRGSCRQPHQGFGGGAAKGGNGNASCRSVTRRTARVSALTGSQRGSPKGAWSPGRTPEAETRAPGSGQVSKPPLRTASPPRLGVQPRRDSGGRQRCRPPLLSGSLGSARSSHQPRIRTV